MASRPTQNMPRFFYQIWDQTMLRQASMEDIITNFPEYDIQSKGKAGQIRRKCASKKELARRARVELQVLRGHNWKGQLSGTPEELKAQQEKQDELVSTIYKNLFIIWVQLDLWEKVKQAVDNQPVEE